VLLPATWTSRSVADLWILAAVEAALLLLLLTMWDPSRFQWSGRGLLGIAIAAIVLAGSLLEGVETTPLRLLGMIAFSATCTYYALTGRFERRVDEVPECAREFGELRTEGPRLRYLAGGRGWELHRDEILAVGERTSASGDEASLCFLTGLDGEWREVSLQAHGREQALTWLRQELGVPFPFAPRDSASSSSRTLWPPALAGEPLFAGVEPASVAAWPPPTPEGPGLRTGPLAVSPRVLDELGRAAG